MLIFCKAREGFSLEVGISDPNGRSGSYGLPRSHNMPSRRFLEQQRIRTFSNLSHMCISLLPTGMVGTKIAQEGPRCSQDFGPLYSHRSRR